MSGYQKYLGRIQSLRITGHCINPALKPRFFSLSTPSAMAYQKQFFDTYFLIMDFPNRAGLRLSSNRSSNGLLLQSLFQVFPLMRHIVPKFTKWATGWPLNSKHMVSSTLLLCFAYSRVEKRPLGKHTMQGVELELPPIILGRYGSDPQKKTVLVYGHYDVYDLLVMLLI
jgi:hypothetical protein